MKASESASTRRSPGRRTGRGSIRQKGRNTTDATTIRSHTTDMGDRSLYADFVAAKLVPQNSTVPASSR